MNRAAGLLSGQEKGLGAKLHLALFENSSSTYSNVTAVYGEQQVFPEGKSAHPNTPASLLALSALTVPE